MSGYKEQFFTGVAVEQYEQRDATLEGLNDTVKADVDELAREVTPDDSVDRRNIAGTIDDLLPTPHTDLEPLPAFVAHNYSALLEKLKEIQGRIESVDPDYRVVFETLCERTQEAYDSFQDTNCPDAEALFVSLINKIEEEVDRFMSFHIPPLEQVHQQAVTLAGQCDAFEVKRDSEDWSGALLNEEADIYALVDDVLAQLDALFEESAEVLSNWETADVDSIHDAYAAELEALKRQVREAAAEMAGRKATLDSQVANEEAKFNKAQRDMQNELRSCEVEAQNKQAQVESLVNQIKQLSDKLKQAQLDLWRAQKQAIILNTGLLMLNDRHNANTSANGSELDSVNHALNDSRVAIDNANVAEAMSRQVAQQVHRIRTEQEDALRANEFNLLIDKIELTTRKYYKTALALYANEARIKMKKHEREGVLVKKQRMNSGQDIAGVQECNEEIAVIDRVIAEEEENKAQLEDDLRTLGTSWGEYFDEAKSLQSTPAMKKKCMVVGSGWQTAIHKLKERQNMAAGEEILALLGSISILRDSPTRTGSPSRS